MINSTVITEYIKTKYLGGINNQLWKMNYLLNRIKASNMGVNPSNKTVEVRLRMGNNGGVAQSAVIPTSGNSKHITSSSTLKKGYAFLEIDGDAMTYAPDGDEDVAFMGAVSGETASLLEAMNRNFETNLHLDGSGNRGVIASVVNADPTYTVTLTTDNMAWFEIGQIVDFIDPATGVVQDRGMVTGVDTANTAITFVTDGTVTTDDPTAADIICNQREGVLAASVTAGTNPCMMGMQGIIGTGTLQSVAGATYELWRGNVVNAAGAITKDIMDNAMIYGARSGGYDFIETTEAILLDLSALLTIQRQYVNTETFEGGWKGITWGGVEVVSNMFMPAGQLNMVNSKSLELRQMKHSPNGAFSALTWESGLDGNMFAKVLGTGSVEKYQGIMRWDSELVTNDRKANTRIYGIV